MSYIKLEVGAVRHPTDQVRRTIPYGKLYEQYDRDDKDFRLWQPVRLVGHPILPSDVIVAEFRREVAVD